MKASFILKLFYNLDKGFLLVIAEFYALIDHHGNLQFITCVAMARFYCPFVIDIEIVTL